MSAPVPTSPEAPHVPVLLVPILRELAPITGTWLDGTMGAGGYTRGLLDAGANTVFGVDRDPLALQMADAWGAPYGDRLVPVHGVFSALDTYSEAPLDGVVLDLGVSSMQLDLAERGFSFSKDGPLDMRMGQDGLSAADLVNEGDEAQLADILHSLGEERAARRIARAIVKRRADGPISTTWQLVEVVQSCLPRSKPGQSHPATRSFQALRIAVNDELGELVAGLEAAERALAPGGALAVVTFHSIEDRIVKRYLTEASSSGGGGSRYAPQEAARAPRFTLPVKALGPDADELAINPRSRSARLRIARRTDEPAQDADRSALGLPRVMGWDTTLRSHGGGKRGRHA